MCHRRHHDVDRDYTSFKKFKFTAYWHALPTRTDLKREQRASQALARESLRLDQLSDSMKVGTFGGFVAAVLLLVSPAVVQAAYTDVDILQFALNLECLEAEFYSWVANGVGLTRDVAGNGNLTATPSGGRARTWTPSNTEGVAIAQEIADNEIAHVKYLRAALTQAGATPISCPALSLGPEVFTAAANASVVTANPGATLDNYPADDTQFNPYEIEDHFYLAAFIFEDVGVTAYKGAIANLQNPAYASAAAGIMALEAGHSATIRAAIPQSSPTGLMFTPQGGASTPIDYATAANAITKLRDALAGTTAESLIDKVYAADANGVAFSRTPSQILDIVYFGSYTKPGGFYPNGVAGNTAVTEITANSTKQCSGAVGMASLSVVTAAAVAVTAAFAL